MKLADRSVIPTLWGEYGEHIIAALNHSSDRWDEASVLGHLLTSPLWFFWVDPRFAAVARFLDFPKMRVCEIIFLGGAEMAEWEHHEETLCAWAQSLGAKEADVYGRKGWARVGKDRGWKVTGIRMTKDLSNG